MNTQKSTEVTPEEKEALWTRNLLIRGIPRQLYLDFKSACASAGVTMTAQIIKLIKAWVYGKEGS